jgi:hypothetical protein
MASMQTQQTLPLISRILGTLRLNGTVIAEIERDEDATVQAVILVALAGIANGIGVVVTNEIGYLGFVTALGGGFLAWVIFSAAAFFIGAGIMPGDRTELEATSRGVFRTVGFAQAPNILGIAVIIGLVGEIISFGGLLWTLVCGIVALRVALRVSTARAVVIGVIAGVITLIVTGIVTGLFEALFV